MADKPVKRITSLQDFAPADVDVRLELDDHVEIVPMRQLSYAEFQRLGWDVPNPLPPISGVDGSKRPIYDTNNADYRKALAEAEQLRSYKRLLASLAVDVPGDTEAEKIAFLQGMDANRMRLLLGIVGQLVLEGQASVEAKSASFQRGRGAGRKGL